MFHAVPRIPRTYPIGGLGFFGSKCIFFWATKWRENDSKTGQKWSKNSPKLAQNWWKCSKNPNPNTKKIPKCHTKAEQWCHSAKGKGTKNIEKHGKTPKSDHKSAQSTTKWSRSLQVRKLLATLHPNCLAVVFHVCFRLPLFHIHTVRKLRVPLAIFPTSTCVKRPLSLHQPA